MAKVHIKDPVDDESPAQVGYGLRKLHEVTAEQVNSQISIVNTVEAMQMAVEDFSEHIDQSNVSFKQTIMEKVKALKKTDTTVLTERVEELKGQEGSELSRLNAIFTEKKLKARQMEAQVSALQLRLF